MGYRVRAKQQQALIDPKVATAQLKKTDDEIVRLNKLKDHQMMTDDAELARMQQQALEQNVQQSTNAFQGIGRSFQQMSAQNKEAMLDSAKFGEMTTSAFATSAVSSIQQWAAGHESASKAVEGMFAHMAGQMATQYGELMLLASIWPPNPIGIAGGTALIALGTVLSGMGGPSMSSGLSGGGGNLGGVSAGGGGGSLTMPSTTQSLPSGAAQQTNNGPSSVQINVQGSIFDTQSTQTRIADLVRNASDSTDFSVAKVGGGV